MNAKISDIISMLENKGTRDASHKLLVLIGANSVPLLSKSLNEAENRIIREEICSVLGRMGPVAKDAVSTLLQKAKNDPNRFVREAAENAIKIINPSHG